MNTNIYISEPHEPTTPQSHPYCEVMCRIKIAHVDKNAQWVEFVPLFDLGLLYVVRINPSKVELELELTEAVQQLVGPNQKKRFIDLVQVVRHLKALLLVIGKWRG